MSDIPPPQGFANYPRPDWNQRPSPYYRPPGIYIDAIGDAWRIINGDMWFWVATSLLFLVLYMGTAFPLGLLANKIIYGEFLPTGAARFDLPLDRLALSMLPQLAAGVVYQTLMAGILFTALKQIRGEETGIGGMFSGFRRFGSIAVLSLVTNLAFLIPYVMVLSFQPVLEIVGLVIAVAGVFLYGSIAMAPLLVLDRNLGPVEAISANIGVLGWRGFLFFFLLFISGIVAGLGCLACGFGILVTWPIVVLIIALHYHYYFDGERIQAQPQMPQW